MTIGNSFQNNKLLLALVEACLLSSTMPEVKRRMCIDIKAAVLTQRF